MAQEVGPKQQPQSAALCGEALIHARKYGLLRGCTPITVLPHQPSANRNDAVPPAGEAQDAQLPQPLSHPSRGLHLSLLLLLMQHRARETDVCVRDKGEGVLIHIAVRAESEGQSDEYPLRGVLLYELSVEGLVLCDPVTALLRQPPTLQLALFHRSYPR
eukprot:CAMPEP_0177776938 /NCGR_PEP_ID=MMETSP0491_2-20121128/15000_1 /TAXON_ID=63592 /ORGANISM="Tetraselmis chuii, Strain PLY429" /LENGTH=159 /DNA_ID=CAMNT_0019295803 /DNA_START=1238 /DNA_END=1717 /DNA_ORIENTATION=+